jgi:plasmid stability protein
VKQLIVRLDDDLHARLKARAARQERSMNSLVEELLERELPPEDRREALRRRAEALGIRFVDVPPPDGRVPSLDEAIEMTRGAGPVFSEALDWARGDR